MSTVNKKMVKLKLPDGVSLPDGVKLPEFGVGEATLRKIIFGEDGKTYEVEEKIELPIIK